MKGYLMPLLLNLSLVANSLASIEYALLDSSVVPLTSSI
jgi:hypothetical protein